MYFPLSPWDMSLWLAFMAIIALITAEILPSCSELFGDFVIEKERLELAALLLGTAFMIAVATLAFYYI